MKRRSAIKGLSAIALGVTLFPSCSDGLTLVDNANNGFDFNEQQSMWIEAISDAILPKDGLQLTTFESFPQFVSKMVPFGKSNEDRLAFVSGYNHCTNDIKEIFQTNVEKVSPEQIIEYFEDLFSNNSEVTMSDPKEAQEIAEKSLFCKELRSLSIRHLKTSKEYQEDILEYKLIPDAYNACVPV